MAHSAQSRAIHLVTVLVGVATLGPLEGIINLGAAHPIPTHQSKKRQNCLICLKIRVIQKKPFFNHNFQLKNQLCNIFVFLKK